jgi:hypothetical protein
MCYVSHRATTPDTGQDKTRRDEARTSRLETIERAQNSAVEGRIKHI